MHMFTAKGHAWSGSAQESVLRRGGASVASLGLVILVATIMLLPPIPPSGDSILPAPSRCDEDVDEAIAQSKGLEGAMGHPLAGPSGFLENRGQLTDPLVRFYTTTAPVAAGFTPAGVRFLLRDTVENGPGPSPTGCDGTVPGITYQLTFGNAEPVEPEGMGALQIPTRVYSGQYRGIRLDDVASFSEIIYQSIYPGIDLRFYFNGGRLKYEFKVGPGADAGRVLLTYEGVSDLAVEPCSGDLLIDVDGHQVRDERPVIIQESPQGRLSIPSSFMLSGSCSYGFTIPATCDANAPFVIDPGLLYCTYLGGERWDDIRGLALDSEGNVCVSGSTYSPDFPVTTPGSVVSFFQDIFIVKLDPTCSRIIFSTLVQGARGESAYGLRELQDGSWVIVGATCSGNMPTTPLALNRTYNGGWDGFVVKLASNGTLTYCSYVGGTGNEYLIDVQVDDQGSVYMAGWTFSTDLWCNPNAFCTTFEPTYLSPAAAFVLKTDASISRVDFCTYINNLEAAYWNSATIKMSIGPSGDIYIAGTTCERSFQNRGSGYSTIGSGSSDGFVMRMAPTGDRSLNFTFLGGSAIDRIHSVAISGDGRVLVCGSTNSTDFPCSNPPGEFGWGAFLVALDESLGRVELTRCVSSTSTSFATALSASLLAERAYVLGYSSADDLPCTYGCFDPVRRYEYRPFLLAVNISTDEVDYCTYLAIGRSSSGSMLTLMLPTGMAIGTGDVLYVGGRTNAHNFTTTPSALSPSYRGGDLDAFVMAFDPRACGLPGVPSGVLASDGLEEMTISWRPPSYEGAMVLRHLVYRGESPDAMPTEPIATVHAPLNCTVDTTAVPGIRYYYRVSAVNSAGEGGLSEASVGRSVSVPGRPLNLTAVNELGSIHLSWEPPENDGGLPIMYYDILRGPDMAGLSPYHTTVKLEFVDQLVRPSETYCYGIVPINTLGSGKMATTMIIDWPTNPSAPQGLGLRPGDEQITVQWLPPERSGGPPIVSYRIYAGTSQDSLEPCADIQAPTTSYTQHGLSNGATYYYKVTALNAFYEGPATGMLAEVPFGRPSEPLNVSATGLPHKVALSWDPPSSTNGRTIQGYRIYSGLSPNTLFYLTWTISTSFNHAGLVDGIAQFYEIVAFNEAGESFVRSEPATAIPMSPPGTPTDFFGQLVPGGVSLDWGVPTDLGGALNITYQLSRASPGTDETLLGNITEGLAYLDGDVEVGVTYVYRLRAINPAGPSEGTLCMIQFVVPPGPAMNFTAWSGIECVHLEWASPLSDGGSQIEAYFIYRGTSPESMERINWTNGLTYLDIDVKAGTTYLYYIQAKNARYNGTASNISEVVPWELPHAPTDVEARYVEGKALLGWVAPARTEAQAPVTGYRILRGLTPQVMPPIAEVGDVLSYIDDTVERGPTYFYGIVPISTIGDGESSRTVALETGVPGTGLSGTTIVILLILAVICLLIVVGIVGQRRAAAEAARIAAAASGAAAAAPGPTHIVEEIFVVYRDGRLMATCSREECRTEDADLMSGMLIAVQGIIQDGLHKGGELESIKYGDNLILMASGPFVNLAAVIYGEPDAGLRERLSSTVQSVETSYAGVIEEWTGELTQVAGIEGIVSPLVQATASLTRSDIRAVKAVQSVSVLSAVDFYRGYVRLKVAAVNATEGLIADVAMEVAYDADMLRLEQVEPETLVRKGDRVSMGNIKPGERKTVAFFFDPQICQGTHIDGLLTYVDSQGVRNRVEMKRRHADVVCPIFFTREHANTAMLRRLIKEGLDKKDLRVFRYPRDLSPEVVLTLGRAAMGGTAVQLVREYIERGPPYYAEVWYYGETKVHSYKMVMRLGVVEEKQAIELFVASTAMEPITGLIAEFRRELAKVVGEKASSVGGLGLERDEALEVELSSRELMIDTVPDENPSPDGSIE